MDVPHAHPPALIIKLPVIPHHPRGKIREQQLFVKPVCKHFQVAAIGTLAVYLKKILNDLGCLRVFIFFIGLFVCKRRLLFTRIDDIMKIHEKIMELIF